MNLIEKLKTMPKQLLSPSQEWCTYCLVSRQYISYVYGKKSINSNFNNLFSFIVLHIKLQIGIKKKLKLKKLVYIWQKCVAIYYTAENQVHNPIKNQPPLILFNYLELEL